MNPIVLAICNQKGGVGKTATAQNLGHALAEQGKRILAVDLDPEYHLTTCSGYKANKLHRTIYDVIAAAINLEERPTINEIILPTGYGVDLVPASDLLSGTEPDLYRTSGGEIILRTCLEPVRDTYDFVILDCPPNLGLLTINALVAADEVVIPVQADYLPMKAMQSTLKAISVVQRRANLNPNLAIGGVVVTMTDRSKISSQVIDALREVFRERLRVFDTVIRRRAAIRYAQRENTSVLAYEPTGEAACDYRGLAMEVLHHA
jgi:chromosome partitioning protein